MALPYPALGQSHTARAKKPLKIASASKTAPTPAPLSTKDLAARALPRVVTLVVRDADGEILCTGSGFVAGRNKIITCSHVVKDAYSVAVEWVDGHTGTSRGIFADNSAYDMAIIEADTGSVTPLPWADTNKVGPGEDIVAVGSPRGLSGSVSTGIVSAVRILNEAKVIQISAPLSTGSSGGLVMNRSGEVIGVASFQYREGQNLNFAYAAGYAQALSAACPPLSVAFAKWHPDGTKPTTPTTAATENTIYLDPVAFTEQEKRGPEPLAHHPSAYEAPAEY